MSDGYHTFGELYEHRCKLFALLVNTFDLAFGYEPFKTLKNDKGETWEGWFIAGMETPVGQVTYHLPIDMWDMVDAKVIDCNSRYDGHTSSDVLKRLELLATMAVA